MALRTPVRPTEATADQAVEVLIKEARQRQRRRHLLTLGTVVLVALAGVLAYHEISDAGGTHQQPSRNETHPRGVAAGQFAGTWHVHTYYVHIRTDGQGSAMWPIHLDCGSAQTAPGAPCDTVTPETVLVSGVARSVDEIHDGGRAVIRLTSVTGARARAVISGSTEPSVLPDGDATMTVTKSDLLYVTPAGPTTSSPFGRSGFCGPRAAALSLSEQKAANINCGA
jgi:predicted nucleic acid-binding Zn ribbon protein